MRSTYEPNSDPAPNTGGHTDADPRQRFTQQALNDAETLYRLADMMDADAARPQVCNCRSDLHERHCAEATRVLVLRYRADQFRARAARVMGETYAVRLALTA